MMLGHKCFDEVNANTLNTTLANERVLARISIMVSLIDGMKAYVYFIVCTVLYGGETREFELKNKRPTKLSR